MQDPWTTLGARVDFEAFRIRRNMIRFRCHAAQSDIVEEQETGLGEVRKWSWCRGPGGRA